jgi:hypothetical protein
MGWEENGNQKIEPQSGQRKEELDEEEAGAFRIFEVRTQGWNYHGIGGSRVMKTLARRSGL